MKRHLAELGADPADANANVGMIVYGAPFQTLANNMARLTAQTQQGERVVEQVTSGAVLALVGAGIASVIGLAFYFFGRQAPRANPRKRRRS